MRFRLRRHNGAHPPTLPDGGPPMPLARDEDEWSVVRSAPMSPEPEAAPAPAPIAPPATNGFRPQATPGDARAERLIRTVRMELQDLKQTIGSWEDGRDDMVDIDLDAVRANPEAAATLPPVTLVRALAAAADRIAALEREIVSHEREESALRERLARLVDDHSYTRGRMETLHEVIGALHGNLEDLRQHRDRQRAVEGPAPAPRALRPADDAAGMRDQHGSYP